MKKVIFCGTPQISVECIKALIDKNIKPVLVITQPDKFVGRKKEIIYSPVKQYCIDNNIDFLQPQKINEIKDIISEIKPDLLITCAYGQFIPESILSIPKYYSINIHASLLPKLRGGAPIHWSIINGDKKTGITIMEMIKEMDAGDIFYQEEIEILDDDNLETLFKKMEKLAYDVVCKYINNFFEHGLAKTKQNINEITFGLNIKREDEKIDFNKSCQEVYNKIRGLYPIPSAFSIYENKIIKFYKSIKTNIDCLNIENGTILKLDDSGLHISCNDKIIIISALKIEGKGLVENKNIKNYSSFFKINTKFE